MKKFAIKSVVAAVSALSAIAAHAVDLDASPAAPAVFAKEIVLAGSPAKRAITNAANALDVVVKTGYSMSDTEVRYVRVELTNAQFAAATGNPVNVGNAVYGQVNGKGTSVIYFSITAQGGAVPDTHQIIVPAAIEILSTSSPVTATYSLYDQPSQAQAGGSTGRIVFKENKAYINFAKSYDFAVSNPGDVANVEATPAFSAFTSTSNPSTSTAKTLLGEVTYALRTTNPTGASRKLDGTVAADLTHLMDATTKIVVTGDFGLAADSDGKFTTATAKARVFLSNADDCDSVDTSATSVNSTSATFEVGAAMPAAGANKYLCYQPRSGQAIPAATYTAQLVAVAATDTDYVPENTSDDSAGTITRNGTELQAPLVQTTAGFVSRFFLTNTGSLDAAYTVRVMAEDGNTPVTGSLSGTIPGGKSLEIPVSSIVTGWTEGKAPRGTVVFTVARPNSQIQGVYQIVNQTSGAVSNMGMLRPGTN